MSERTCVCAVCGGGGRVAYDDEYPEDGCVPAVVAENERLREALIYIRDQFAPGDERRTYNPDIPLVMDRIRATAREAIAFTTKDGKS